MPVYYGGDSDGSEWDDPWELAYAEYVDQYNFDALEGMELKVFERSRAVDDQAMMVSEVPGPRHVSPHSGGSPLAVDMVDSETAVDNLTEGHDGSKSVWLTGLPVRRMVKGWLFVVKVISVIRTVSRLGLVREILGRTGVILLFAVVMVTFLRTWMIHSHRLCSVISCFGTITLPKRHG